MNDADRMRKFVIRLKANSLHALITVWKCGGKTFTKNIVNEFVMAPVEPSKMTGIIPFAGLFEEIYAALVWVD